MYSRAKCVLLLPTLTRRFVHEAATRKEGPNLKNKDLRARVYMRLYHCFE
jgi:hypothetical protein